MTFKQAVERIVRNWTKIPSISYYDGRGRVPARCVLRDSDSRGNSPEAVWLSVTDHAGSYEVDEEWVGVFPDGNIAWAYASGCSCWDGDFSVKAVSPKDLKVMTFEHPENAAEDWKARIIAFAETLDK